MQRNSTKIEYTIRPILRGRDIKRYGYEFADLWLINTHNGVREKGIKPVNIENYPAIKKHLDVHYTELEKRFDKGVTPYNLRHCAYMEDFYKQKIVWKAVGKNLTFSLLEEGKFLTAPASFITSKFNVYILAFLQSNYGKYYIYNNSNTTGTGDIMLNIQSLEQIPILMPSKDFQKKIEDLVYKIVLSKGTNTKEFEAQIDKIIYEMFAFTEIEMDYINCTT